MVCWYSRDVYHYADGNIPTSPPIAQYAVHESSESRASLFWTCWFLNVRHAHESTLKFHLYSWRFTCSWQDVCVHIVLLCTNIELIHIYKNTLRWAVPQKVKAVCPECVQNWPTGQVLTDFCCFVRIKITGEPQSRGRWIHLSTGTYSGLCLYLMALHVVTCGCFNETLDWTCRLYSKLRGRRVGLS